MALTAPLVPKRRPLRAATDRPPVVVVPVTVWNPVVVRLVVEALASNVWPVTVRVPVAVIFAPVRLPLKNPLPTTERV